MTALPLPPSFSNFDPIRPRPQDALAREAARILARLVNHLHAGNEARGVVKISGDLPIDLFDRMAVWGSAAEELEDDDPAEDDGDAEREHTYG
jgi:hypothetical protein